jgi:hypothetical protein
MTTQPLLVFPSHVTLVTLTPTPSREHTYTHFGGDGQSAGRKPTSTPPQRGVTWRTRTQRLRHVLMQYLECNAKYRFERQKKVVDGRSPNPFLPQNILPRTAVSSSHTTRKNHYLPHPITNNCFSRMHPSDNIFPLVFILILL